MSDIQEMMQNMEALQDNSYPGRGIVIGRDITGENMVQIYWIMGRSPNSRNRVFESKEGRLFTVPADPSKVKDPSLIIYNAMKEIIQMTWDEWGKAKLEADRIMKESNGHLYETILKTQCVYCGKSPRDKRRCSAWFQTFINQLDNVLLNPPTSTHKTK